MLEFPNEKVPKWQGLPWPKRLSQRYISMRAARFKHLNRGRKGELDARNGRSEVWAA